MRNTAVTTESGRQAWWGFVTDIIHVDTNVAEKKDPWRATVLKTESMTLGALASIDKYNMLATFIQRDGFSLQDEVIVCTSPSYLKDVCIEGCNYRVFSGKIYTKR